MPVPDGRYPLINGLDAPTDLHRMSDAQLESLAGEMREAIIDTVSQTGGHLGASLGTVELTIALHARARVARATASSGTSATRPTATSCSPAGSGGFPTLRQYGGISGLPAPGRERARRHGRRPRQHLDLSYATGLAEAPAPGRRRRRPRGLRHRRRRPDRRHGLRGPQPGRRARVADHGGAQRQRHEHLARTSARCRKLFQRVRVDPTLTRVREELERRPRAHPGQPASWAARSATPPSRSGSCRARCSRRSASPTSARSTATTSAPCDGAAAQHARHGPPGRRPREDREGPRLRAGRGRRRGHARRDPLRHRERQGGARSRPARPTTPMSSATRWSREAERDPRVVGITAAMLEGHRHAAHDGRASPSAPTTSGIAEQHAVIVRRAAWRSPATGRCAPSTRPSCSARFDPIVHDVGHPGPARGLRDRPRRPGRRRRPDPPRRLRPRLPAARSPGSRSWRRWTRPSWWTCSTRRCGIDGPVALRYPRGAGLGVPLPPRPRPVEIGTGAGAGGGRGRSPWWATATARRSRARPPTRWPRALGARPTVVNARFCKPIDASADAPAGRAGTSSLVTIEDHAQLAGFGSAVLEALERSPGAGAAPRPARPLRRPRPGAAKLLARRRGPRRRCAAASPARTIAPAPARAVRAC